MALLRAQEPFPLTFTLDVEIATRKGSERLASHKPIRTRTSAFGMVGTQDVYFVLSGKSTERLHSFIDGSILVGIFHRQAVDERVNDDKIIPFFDPLSEVVEKGTLVRNTNLKIQVSWWDVPIGVFHSTQGRFEFNLVLFSTIKQYSGVSNLDIEKCASCRQAIRKPAYQHRLPGFWSS